MSDQQLGEDICRICLDEDVAVHWDDVLYDNSPLTYKDCYYKYTQLEYFDEDNFSSMLCRNCSEGLEYVDAFISRALETHAILEEKVRQNLIRDHNINCEEANFETILLEECEIQSDSTYEDSTEDLKIPDESQTINRYEISKTPLIQKRNEKRKRIKTNETNNSSDEMNDGSLLDDKNSSKKLKQAICCSICSKVLSSRYNAILHEKTHIKERERNETCAECGLKFYSKEILKAHMLTHLKNREKAHKCEFCDKAFFNKGGLNIHKRIHLGQMIPCTLCPKEFYRQFDLDKHMISHSAVRINSDIKMKTKCFVHCKECGKSIRSTSFKSHNAKHMNEPLFRCTICDKEFFSRRSCSKHLKKYHKKKSPDVNNFIIAYKKNRVTHLFLKQKTDMQVKEE